MPENVKFNIHCIYSLFEKCRPYVLISDVMASIRKEKIPKRWYTRPCRTECKTGTEKPGWPVWTGWPGWLCLMMGGGVLIKICSKALRSHLHFWWWWWWWWRWQWWRTLSHIDAQKPIYGIKYLWEFGCAPSRIGEDNDDNDDDLKEEENGHGADDVKPLVLEWGSCPSPSRSTFCQCCRWSQCGSPAFHHICINKKRKNSLISSS